MFFLLIKQNARGFGGSRIMGRVLARAGEQMMYLIMCQYYSIKGLDCSRLYVSIFCFSREETIYGNSKAINDHGNIVNDGRNIDDIIRHKTIRGGSVCGDDKSNK